jgi:hypothetical protein
VRGVARREPTGEAGHHGQHAENPDATRHTSAWGHIAHRPGPWIDVRHLVPLVRPVVTASPGLAAR